MLIFIVFLLFVPSYTHRHRPLTHFNNPYNFSGEPYWLASCHFDFPSLTLDDISTVEAPIYTQNHKLHYYTHNRALCWSERTADETWSWHTRCSWNAGSTCVATDCSRQQNKSATWRTLSCSVSATWTCRTVACLRVCETLCRRSGSSLLSDTENSSQLTTIRNDFVARTDRNVLWRTQRVPTSQVIDEMKWDEMRKHIEHGNVSVQE